ncbi:hypothetical protein EVAR_31603_1 [Eumeta japonica]|uniref:Uncharacterized protein n=1 Tax=Eumeta variegata TaxID=151549 RepID=A0A4C1W0Y1_EUMVA|nr:hypothetical protein EVAR_31603_1 [Eumeta japonica]
MDYNPLIRATRTTAVHREAATSRAGNRMRINYADSSKRGPIAPAPITTPSRRTGSKNMQARPGNPRCMSCCRNSPPLHALGHALRRFAYKRRINHLTPSNLTC